MGLFEMIFWLMICAMICSTVVDVIKVIAWSMSGSDNQGSPDR